MYSVLLFVCLCPSGGVWDQHITIGYGYAWSDQGPLKQRKLLQDTEESFRMSSTGYIPQHLQGQEEQCTDIQPPDSSLLQCSEFAQNGLCDRLAQEFCAISCGFCGCSDEQPNYVSCEEAAQLDLCERALQDGKCKKSCGQCPVAGTKPPSPPTPGFVLFSSPSLESLPPPPPTTPVLTPSPPPSPDFTTSPPPTPTVASASISELEAAALLAFEWSGSKPSSWSGLDPCDNWKGISCENNRVTNISLSYSLQGTLPPQLSNLESLLIIDIDNNDLEGTIPSEYSRLTSLVEFKVYINSLIGTLPPQFSALKQLVIIDVTRNQLAGTLPSQYSELASLQEYYVIQNSLTGTLPLEYSQLTSLEKLWANLNFMTGTVPFQYSNLKNLNVFPQNSGLCLEREFESIMNFDFWQSTISFC